jgi:hypothetical protein
LVIEKNRIFSGLLVAFLLLVSIGFGQGNYSPYSRYGIGKLYSNGNLLNMGMGGTSIGSRNPLFVNPYNPASYTCFDSTSFVFDAGLSARLLTLKTSTVTEKINDAGLSYITMGFPITKWWKTSLGVLPFSSMKYQIGIDSTLENLGNVRFGYNGNGGLNRGYIGNGFKIGKNFSLGVNFSYIFGTLDKVRTVSYPDSGNYFSSRLTNSYIIKNLYFDFGAQYYKELKNGLLLTTGVTFSPGQSLTGSADFLAVTFYHNDASNLDVTKDTALYQTGVEGKVHLPMSAGLGMTLGRSNRWTIGTDFQYTQWSSYKFFGASDSLKNSFRFSLGGQYKPSPMDVGGYLKRINYRAGIRFEKSYLELRNTSLNEIGISFGLGLPMKKSRSTINLAFETGTFGTTDNRLIKENYFRISLGASMFEKWFVKRKYD